MTDPLTGCTVSDSVQVGKTAGSQLTIAFAGDSLSCLRDSVLLPATVALNGLENLGRVIL